MALVSKPQCDRSDRPPVHSLLCHGSILPGTGAQPSRGGNDRGRVTLGNGHLLRLAGGWVGVASAVGPKGRDSVPPSSAGLGSGRTPRPGWLGAGG